MRPGGRHICQCDMDLISNTAHYKIAFLVGDKERKALPTMDLGLSVVVTRNVSTSALDGYIYGRDRAITVLPNGIMCNKLNIKVRQQKRMRNKQPLRFSHGLDLKKPNSPKRRKVNDA